MVHEPERKVEDVDANVYQWPSTLLRLIDEYAPAGDSTLSERLCSRVVNVADLTRRNKLLERLACRSKAAIISDLQKLSGAVRCVDHLLALYRVQRDRLLAEYVLTGFERV